MAASRGPISVEDLDMSKLPPEVREKIRAAMQAEKNAAVGDEERNEEALDKAETPDEVARIEAMMEKDRRRHEQRLDEIAATANASVQREQARQRTLAEQQDKERAAAEAAERKEAAKRETKEEEERIRQQKARAVTAERRQRRYEVSAAKPRHEVASVGHRALTATSILPESEEVRVLDEAIVVTAAAASVAFTASRKTVGGQYGFGAFFTGLGGLMALGGNSEVRHAGYGLLGGGGSYLVLRTFMPDLAKPSSASVAFTTPAGPVRYGYAVFPPS